MKIARWCKLTDLNWEALPDLRSRVERLSVKVDSLAVALHRFPDSITYDSLDEAATAVRTQGAPRYYDVTVSGFRDSKFFQLNISRMSNIHGEEILRVSADGLGDSAALDSLTAFLGLLPEEPSPSKPAPKRTAFIAHRFDERGTGYAERVARFLELIGFNVVTGRAYSPRPVSEKVRERIIDQELLLAILTPGSDDTWLTQEPIVAEAREKPMFLLKQNNYEYKAGLLGDREYIVFAPDHIESTFIPILEGLRELGYELGSETKC